MTLFSLQYDDFYEVSRDEITRNLEGLYSRKGGERINILMYNLRHCSELTLGALALLRRYRSYDTQHSAVSLTTSF